MILTNAIVSVWVLKYCTPSNTPAEDDNEQLQMHTLSNEYLNIYFER